MINLEQISYIFSDVFIADIEQVNADWIRTLRNVKFFLHLALSTHVKSIALKRISRLCAFFSKTPGKSVGLELSEESGK